MTKKNPVASVKSYRVYPTLKKKRFKKPCSEPYKAAGYIQPYKKEIDKRRVAV
jgi:hypothetical protein